MIHGDRTQAQRTGALKVFQDGRVQMLMATDIASRDLYVEEVAHIINYDVPKLAHRVGRTGRAGAQGRASTLVAGAEVLELGKIERTLDLRIEPMQIGFGRPTRAVQNKLASRTLNATQGETFV